MKNFRAIALLAMIPLLVSCSDTAGPTAASPLPESQPSFTKTAGPDSTTASRPPFQADDDKNEEFNCTNVEKVRVRFGSPGFIDGTNVGLFAEFVGMPGEGSKILRTWWDFEGAPDTFEDLDISQEVLPGDEGLFDWDGILEHAYNVRSSTDFRVRIELIIPDQTGNCARVRDVTVAPSQSGKGVSGAGVFFFVNGFRDEFEFTGTPGSTVTIAVDTTSAATTFDPFYVVYTGAGEVGAFINQDDNFPCTFPPPAFSCPTGTFALPADADGRYYVVVRALGTRFDPTRGDYRLTITGAGSPRLITNDY
jgi:hypothetical protein